MKELQKPRSFRFPATGHQQRAEAFESVKLIASKELLVGFADNIMRSLGDREALRSGLRFAWRTRLRGGRRGSGGQCRHSQQGLKHSSAFHVSFYYYMPGRYPCAANRVSTNG